MAKADIKLTHEQVAGDDYIGYLVLNGPPDLEVTLPLKGDPKAKTAKEAEALLNLAGFKNAKAILEEWTFGDPTTNDERTAHVWVCRPS